MASQSSNSSGGPSSHASGSGSGEGDDDFATPPLPAIASASASSSIDAPMAGPSSSSSSAAAAPQHPPVTPYSRHHALNRISRAIASSIASSEEKVGLALSAYQLIDRQCRRLDVELAKMTGQPTTPAQAASGAVAPSGEAMRPGTMESGVSQKHTGALAKGGQEEEAGAGASAEASGSGTTRRTRKRKASSGAGAATEPVATAAAAASTAATAQPPPDVTGTAAVDMAYDPNEPVYCYCQQPSSGSMVGCDNEEDPLGRTPGCPREWYHLACLEARGEMTQQGYEELEDSRKKWYCADCRVALGLPPVVLAGPAAAAAAAGEWVDDADETMKSAGSPKGNKRRKKAARVGMKKPGKKTKSTSRQQQGSSRNLPKPKASAKPQAPQPRGSKARPVATPRARAMATPKTKVGARAAAAAARPAPTAANRGKRKKAYIPTTTPAKTRRSSGSNKR